MCAPRKEWQYTTEKLKRAVEAVPLDEVDGIGAFGDLDVSPLGT